MMNITRHNYEEYFLLYVDNELNVAQRKAVDEFVQQNPDLEEELVMLQQSVLRPDKQVVFDNKKALLKNVPVNLVNESNCEEYFVLYGDNELTNAEKDLVEQFVYKHPQYQEAFELIQQAKLFAENTIVYPDKNDLYRSEEDHKVIPFPWRRIAAAAAILLFIGSIGWYIATRNTNPIVKTPTNNPAQKNNNTLPVITDNNKQDVLVKKDNPSNIINQKEEQIIPVNDKSFQHPDAIVKSPKNNKERSNIPEHEIVTPETQEVAIKENDIPNGRQIEARPVYAAITDNSPVINVVNTGTAKASNPRTALKMEEIEVINLDEQPEDGNVYASTASSKKSPIRGLLRKVSRVFDKATNIGDTENDKKSLRIASFAIALK